MFSGEKETNMTFSKNCSNTFNIRWSAENFWAYEIVLEYVEWIHTRWTHHQHMLYIHEYGKFFTNEKKKRGKRWACVCVCDLVCSFVASMTAQLIFYVFFFFGKQFTRIQTLCYLFSDDVLILPTILEYFMLYLPTP